jgi:rhodanese-related sulfurtransferase
MVELDKTAMEFVEEAEPETELLDVEAVDAERERSGTVLVDIRDVRELWREGTIPDAEHVPRGMLEFWADPESEYYRDFFDPDKRIVLFCNKASRSALAAKRLQELGYPDVAHLDGGFTAWDEAGKSVDDVEPRE